MNSEKESKDLNWTNPDTDEKFIHKERTDGSIQFIYGPKDSDGEKNHGHAEFDRDHTLTFNRDPNKE